MEPMNRTRYGGMGVEHPCPLPVYNPSSTSTCAPAWKLLKSPCSGVFTELNLQPSKRLVFL